MVVLLCLFVCLEFIQCKETSVCVIEYNLIDDDKYQLKLIQTFDLAPKNVNYNADCGICVVPNKSDTKYDIILFGNNSYGGNFASSLQWLSLNTTNNSISIKNDKTKQFQKAFADAKFEINGRYRSFGYTKWRHYLILFGGIVNDKTIDSVFYCDLPRMKWYKSLKVLSNLSFMHLLTSLYNNNFALSTFCLYFLYCLLYRLCHNLHGTYQST